MINGLYDAKMDNQPVVAIVGQQGLASLGTAFQQENNLERAFSDVADYVQTIVSPEQAQVVVDRACRIALTHLQPTIIIIPHDVQGMKRVKAPKQVWVSRSSAAPTLTALTPPAEEIARAAEILNAGKKIAILVGNGRAARPRRSSSSRNDAELALSLRCAGRTSSRVTFLIILSN
jgi:pyruvate dehydrogenase (quinone)